jgi:hypothetical protein
MSISSAADYLIANFAHRLANKKYAVRISTGELQLFLSDASAYF